MCGVFAAAFALDRHRVPLRCTLVTSRVGCDGFRVELRYLISSHDIPWIEFEIIECLFFNE